MTNGIGLVFLSNFIIDNVQYIILLMTVMLFVSLIFFININIKLTRMNKRYKKLMTGMDGCNIERLLMGHVDEVRETVKRMEEIECENRRIDHIAKQGLQKIGVIRFSAFEDMGSDLSYAIAMLDHQNNGIVLSSIFGREESRCYAKPIIGGDSTYALTEEEKAAIREAIKK